MRSHKTLQCNNVEYRTHKLNQSKSYTALDDVPPRQEPRDWGSECNSDGNTDGEQRLVAEDRERERTTSGGGELRRAILGRRVDLVIGGRIRVRVLVIGNSAHVELFENGFNVDVVSDGDVETGDGGGGDAQVNT